VAGGREGQAEGTAGKLEQLVSLADPDARPIIKGKSWASQPSSANVTQLAEVTENTKRAAREG
jgi:hypothetical protein